MRHVLFSVSEKEQVHPTRRPTSAFDVLMASQRERKLPTKKPGTNAKEKLFNDLVDDFKEHQLDFPASEADELGKYIIQSVNN